MDDIHCCHHSRCWRMSARGEAVCLGGAAHGAGYSGPCHVLQREFSIKAYPRLFERGIILKGNRRTGGAMLAAFSIDELLEGFGFFTLGILLLAMLIKRLSGVTF